MKKTIIQGIKIWQNNYKSGLTNIIVVNNESGSKNSQEVKKKSSHRNSHISFKKRNTRLFMAHKEMMQKASSIICKTSPNKAYGKYDPKYRKESKNDDVYQ